MFDLEDFATLIGLVVLIIVITFSFQECNNLYGTESACLASNDCEFYHNKNGCSSKVGVRVITEKQDE